MDEKTLRLNMIKVFALGMKCVNDAIENSETQTDSAIDYIDMIFSESDGTPSYINEILDRLENYKNINHIDENKRTRQLTNKIYQNNQAIESIKQRVDKLCVIKK